MTDYENDALLLREAIKGAGTDEDTLINLTAKRTNTQRGEIRKAYKAAFGRDLIEDLHDDVGGDFGNVVTSMYLSPVEYDVNQIRKAMEGSGTDENVLSEIIGSRSNYRLKEIISLYKVRYDEHLEDRVKSECSGDYGTLLVSLLQCSRDSSNTVNEDQVQEDANALYKAGEGKWGTDEETFNRIFALRNSHHLKRVNQVYMEQRKSSLLDVVEDEFSGDMKNLLATVLHSHINPADYFATRIYKACKGVGTDEETVTRALVVMDEVYMEQMKQIFQVRYGVSLREMIDSECSGNFKRMLLALMDS
jgi:hypothetical protein